MDAAENAAAGLLLRQVPEPAEIARDRRQTHGARIGDRERDVVTVERQLERPRGCRRQTRNVPAVRRVRWRREERRPTRVGVGLWVEILRRAPDRGHWPPQS